MSLTGLMWIFGGIVVSALVFGLIRTPARPCRACNGVGLIRGKRGRWAGFCAACRGSGQRDTWSTRVLVKITRGWVLPPAGSAADGIQHAQGYRFDGRAPGGRWRAAPDPDDTRLAALVGRRLPARERAVDKAQARLDGARGPAWIVAALRRATARAALRRAHRAAERHREDLDEHAGGYRRLAGRGRRHRGSS